MHLLAGPYAALAALVVLGGAPKTVRPDATARALASVRLPFGSSPRLGLLVRLLGAVEVALGVAALTVGGTLPAVGLAVSYAGFAAFVALALARGGTVSSCGCFGTPDTPPTRVHLAVNLAAATAAALVAADPAPRLGSVLAHQPGAGVPFLALTALVTWFAYLALARLPGLTAPTQRTAA